jgi:uncharacterized RDD family membrane protein YckC
MEIVTLTPTVREHGIQALQDGNLDRALDLLGRAVSADGGDAEARAFLGIAYSQTNRHGEARRTLEEAVALQPRDPRFRFNLGVALESAGDAAAAAAAYREVLKLYPAHPQARAKLNALEPPLATAPHTGPRLQGSCRPASSDTSPVDDSALAAPSMSVGEAFARRSAATLLDSAVVTVITYVVSYLIGLAVCFPVAAVGGPEAVRSVTPFFMGLGLLVGLVIGWVYCVLPLGRYGQTVGRMLLGIRVVGPDGANPGPWRGAMREVIGKFLSDFLLLGYLWMLWDPQQQTWHDKIAGTRVERA